MVTATHQETPLHQSLSPLREGTHLPLATLDLLSHLRWGRKSCAPADTRGKATPRDTGPCRDRDLMGTTDGIASPQPDHSTITVFSVTAAGYSGKDGKMQNLSEEEYSGKFKVKRQDKNKDNRGISSFWYL